jgi:sugar lactone lactonase YvrE
VVRRVEGFPFCLEWAAGGELLVVEGRAAVVSRDGEPWADLGGIDGVHPWNDVVADSRGNVFVNNIGYDFPGGEERPGIIAVVGVDARARVVADGLAFPNGMAVTSDDSTLIVAESHAGRLSAYDIGSDGSLSRRRVWAAVEGSAPDGVCLDPSGAIWYADVPNRQCVLVREGGEVVRTVGLADGAFDCALGDAVRGDGRLHRSADVRLADRAAVGGQPSVTSRADQASSAAPAIGPSLPRVVGTIGGGSARR